MVSGEWLVGGEWVVGCGWLLVGGGWVVSGWLVVGGGVGEWLVVGGGVVGGWCGGGWEVGGGRLVVGWWVLGQSRSHRSGSWLRLRPDQKVLWLRLQLRNPAENYAKRSEQILRKSFKRKEAKNFEAKRSEKCCENL